MDRGGTITWYLNANDTNFQVTVRKVREEAKKTGEEVDRSTKKGFGNAKLSLEDFDRSMSKSANRFRNFQIALRGFELSALIITATTAAGAIIQLASAVAALGGLLYTIPAGVGVAASAISTLAVATGGVGDAFKEIIKPVKGATAAQNLARRQSDITASAMKRDASLVRQLTDLNEEYGDILQQLAEERMRVLNEQIQRGTEAWTSIANAARTYLDISAGLADLNLGVSQAQAQLTDAIFNYGAASQQAVEASRNLFAAQGRLAQSNADLDQNFSEIRDNVKDLATNLESLRKANRNQITATQANLKALRLDKQARGENTDEVSRMIEVLDQLGNIKDTTLNVSTEAAQAQLDEVKRLYPDIAVAAQASATDTEKSLTKSLGNIAESMEDVRRERQELAAELSNSLAEAAEQSAQGQQGKDPFAGLSTNARNFVIALKEVYDAFQPIKNEIQDKFFAGLDTEVRNLAEVSFPTLRTGMGLVADSMNGLIKEASRVVQQPFFQGAIANSFSTTAQATDILKGAVEPLARAFTDLMNIGNPYVIMLADWVVKQSELAAAFTGSEKGQKKINKAIQMGVNALKDLGGLLKEVFGLFTDVFSIGQDSGVNMIQTLTNIVKSMRDYIGTEEGQKRMTALFEAADTILQAFAGNAGTLLKALLGLVEAYNNLDGPAKDLITTLIAYSVILTPLLTYFSSLFASMKLIFGVGKEAAQAVGLIGQSAGFAKQAFFDLQSGFNDSRAAGSAFTGVAGTIGGKLREAVDGAKAAGSAVVDYGKKFAITAADAAKHAGTIAAQGTKAAAGWVAGGARIAAGWLVSFAQLIARGVVVVATMVAQAAVTAAAWVAGAVATAAAWVVANAAMLGIFGLIVLAVVGAVALIVANWDTIKGFFIGVFNTIKDAVAGAINWVKENWPLLLAILTGPIGLAVYTITQNWDTIKNAFRAAWEFIKGVWNEVGGFFNGIWNTIVNIFNRIKDGIINAFWQAVNWIRGLPGQILGALGNLGNMLWDSGWSLIMGLWNGINHAFSNVKNWVADRLRNIRNLFPFSPAKEGPFSGMGYTEHSGVALMRDFGEGIVSMGGTVLNQTEGIVGQVADAFSGLASDVGAMQTNFGITSNATMATEMSGFAPSVMDARDGNASLNNGTPVVINQNNTVNTELDMDQVNRNLAWEMNKL